MKQYHRESITVWASEESGVMEKCNKQVQYRVSIEALIIEVINLSKPSQIFVWSYISGVCVQNPSMPYMFTLRRGALLLLLFYTGLLPFVPLEESLLLFYLPSVINRSVNNTPLHSLLCDED